MELYGMWCMLALWLRGPGKANDYIREQPGNDTGFEVLMYIEILEL